LKFDLCFADPRFPANRIYEHNTWRLDFILTLNRYESMQCTKPYITQLRFANNPCPCTRLMQWLQLRRDCNAIERVTATTW